MSKYFLLWIITLGLCCNLLYANRSLQLNLTYDVAPFKNELKGTTQISTAGEKNWKDIQNGDVITPGEYIVRFLYDGYQQTQQNLSITHSKEPFVVKHKLTAKYRNIRFIIDYDVFPSTEAYSSHSVLIDKKIPYFISNQTQVKPGSYLFSIKQPGYDDTPFTVQIIAGKYSFFYKKKLSKTEDIYMHGKKRQLIFQSTAPGTKQLMLAQSILINGNPVSHVNGFTIGSQLTIEATFKKYGSIKIPLTIPKGYGPIVVKIPLEKKSILVSSLFSKENKTLKPPHAESRRLYRHGHYLYPIVKLQKQEQRYLLSQHKSSYTQLLGVYFSYIGHYQKALEYFDNNKKEQKPQAIDLDKYQVLDAAKAICEVASTKNVIFINEAHHIPQHRVLPIMLLKKLYKQGFRYFAAETLNQYDKMEERGYPVFSSGYYTQEPLYGDLVRTAIKLGYKVVAYEHMGPRGQKQRDEGQARNLYERIFKSDPNAKVLVHAGYAHIYEKETPYWSPMAKYFREISGIDPFTIDQTKMSECSKISIENPYFQWIQNKIAPQKAIVLRTAKNTFWVNKEEFYDCQVFHPRSKYKKNRPQWLSLGGQRKEVIIPIEDVKTLPILIQALDFSEEEQTKNLPIPIDQIAIWKKQQICLYLPKGKFLIRFMDENGNVFKKFTHFVK
ncbi:hypothetical protein [Candidatus Uabimicrobium sp. HlEnr_7]|uniref:hypothetical protein n=1 Tax=Candidatus Uabimicrobium helgolandensis TaxID=3095367 RepID=UPI0035591A04